MRTKKPERREKTPVDLGDVDMESPTPQQQSSKAGPGAGGGRERSRRLTERVPRAAGAKAKQRPHDTTMMDRAVEKKMRARLRAADAGESTENLAAPEEAVRKQPRRQGAKKQSRAAKSDGARKAKRTSKRAAASAEAAPTQKQVLAAKTLRKRTLRNTGVQGAE